MSKRRRSALTTLALAVAALFALPASPASAGTATTSNACANSVTANFSQIGVTTSGDDGLTTVAPGGTTTTTGLSQQAAIPGAIFVAGYNLGLLVQGTNNVPANVRSTIEATNTVQGQQLTNVVGGTPPNGTVAVTTTITDPDGTPGTGDETATDASFSVTYNNLTWTAGASGTIDYRQQSIATAPPTAANNALLINALVGGVFNVQFRCAPGTVTPPDPGIITLIDPAGSFDTTDIVVPDTAPTANAGPDQTVDEGTLVTLDGTASSDPEGEALTYNWTAPAGITLSDPTSATPTFTAPQVSANTPFTFTLEVCDQAPVLCSNPDDTVTITVRNVVVDLPPIANAGPDQTVDEGTLVTLDGTASSDPNGEALTYNWTAPAGITLSDPTSATPTFTAPQVSANTPFTFTLEVCDQAPVLCSNPDDTVTITVRNVVVDLPPIANAGPDQTVDEGTLVTLDGTASSDPNGEALTYNWTAPAGITLSDPTSATPTFTAPQVSANTPFTFTLEVCDQAPVLCSNPDDTVTITVRNVVVDLPPIANAGPDQTVDEGTLVTLDGTASSDPNGEALTYNWTAPAGITLSDPTSATPTFTAPQVSANTPFTFTLEVCDQAPVLCSNPDDTVTITVRNVVVDLPPIADAGPDQTVTEGDLVTLDGTGSSDPEGEALTYAWSQTGGPAVTLSDPSSAMPTFTAPDVATPTDLTFSLQVCDEANPDSKCSTDTVVITDNNIDDPPISNAGPDQTVSSGATVTLNGNGSSDPNGEALTYTWSQTAGPAVTLSDPTSPTPTFTAPTVAVPTDLTFSLDVCDEPPVLCSDPDDTVTIHVQPIVRDATGLVIVNGPVSSTKTSKSFVFKVSNIGMTPITINPVVDISSTVTVNGTETGIVTPNSGAKTLNPGASTRVKLVWSYAAGALATGDTVVFNACVNVAGDIDTSNDCDDETATAK